MDHIGFASIPDIHVHGTSRQRNVSLLKSVNSSFLSLSLPPSLPPSLPSSYRWRDWWVEWSKSFDTVRGFWDGLVEARVPTAANDIVLRGEVREGEPSEGLLLADRPCPSHVRALWLWDALSICQAPSRGAAPRHFRECLWPCPGLCTRFYHIEYDSRVTCGWFLIICLRGLLPRQHRETPSYNQAC